MASQQSPLPTINRYITTHDERGDAIFSKQVSEESPMIPIHDGLSFALSYTTKSFPIDTTSEADIGVYSSFLSSRPGLTISNGSVLRHVDFPPASTGRMHRTVSLDYGILLEGEVECLLDSGETRMLKRGDVVVQRGTMHAWRNPSETEWCRMVFVLLPIKEIVLEDGEKLGEDLSGTRRVRSSI